MLDEVEIIPVLHKVTGAGHSLWGGGVVVSEFSVAWGKRGEGGQGREGVQLPDSLMDEAVLQSAGPRLETPQSPPWWQQSEEAVCRVGGITCNAEGNDLLSCSHYPLKGLAAGRIAGAIPHSDAASQDALDGASVESAHDGSRGSGSFEFAEEVETLLCCCEISFTEHVFFIHLIFALLQYRNF